MANKLEETWPRSSGLATKLVETWLVWHLGCSDIAIKLVETLLTSSSLGGNIC